MAALLSLVQEILPMIMPSSISVTKASDILPLSLLPEAATDQNGNENKPRIRVLARDAVVDKTDKMCASVLLVTAQSSSTVRHHGEQDAIIYAASGKGILLSSPKDEDETEQPVKYPLEQGDFAFVPAWTEHQALNESEADLVWVIIRSGSHPVEVNLMDWGGAEMKSPQTK